MSQIDPNKKTLTRITCAQHGTAYLRAEVEALGFEIQDEDIAGVHIGATLIDCLKLNLNLHTAQHVLWLLTHFRCPSPKALYTQAAAYPWVTCPPRSGPDLGGQVTMPRRPF